MYKYSYDRMDDVACCSILRYVETQLHSVGNSPGSVLGIDFGTCFWAPEVTKFWGCSRVVLGLFWGCSGAVLELFQGCSGLVLGVLWGRSRVILGLLWGRSGLVLGLFWGCSGFEALV